jgi:hypothetical protein
MIAAVEGGFEAVNPLPLATCRAHGSRTTAARFPEWQLVVAISRPCCGSCVLPISTGRRVSTWLTSEMNLPPRSRRNSDSTFAFDVARPYSAQRRQDPPARP